MQIVVCPNCGAKNRIGQLGEHLQPVCGRCHTKLNTAGAGSASAAEPVSVTDDTLPRVLAGAGPKPVLIDFWAPWCGPCRMIAPAIEELARESNGRWLVGKLNVDENPQTAQQHRIDSIPALLIFKNGKVADRIVGLQPKAALAQRLAKLA